MGLFDEDNIKVVPVNAQMLKDMITERSVKPNDSMEVRCDKLLRLIYNRVRFNTEESITHHDTSLAALGINGSPFSHEYTDSINKLIKEGKSKDDIYSWIDSHPVELTSNLQQYVKFFHKRGFTVFLLTYKYLVTDPKERDEARVIRISWD